MCELCSKVKENQKYLVLLEKMLTEDKARLEYSKKMSEKLSVLQKVICTTMEYPVKLSYPMFDARTAYSVPNNYYQNIFVEGERCGVAFAHGAMRSVFFSNDKLIVFSKTVSRSEGKEFFTSFLLAHFEENEYSYTYDNGVLKISANTEKPVLNLITGKKEKKKILFNFINNSVKGRIVSRDRVLASAQFKKIYGKFGGAVQKAASMDMEGYAVTVPHFSPHPYLLQLHKELGYASNRDFQEKTIDYFKNHLKI